MASDKHNGREEMRTKTTLGTAISIALSTLSMVLPGTSYASDTEVEEIEEVVVTGSYIRRKNQAGFASPINTVTLEDMQANGWSNLEDVMETFTFSPSNFGRESLINGAGSAGIVRAIDLRGLGVSSTLTLLNGKRTASTATDGGGASFTNIKRLVPLIAISQIETVLDGSAALYGSDAIAGVVNMKTRADFEGFETRIGSKQIEGSGQSEAQFIVGAGNDDIRGMFALSFEQVDLLQNRDRPFTLLNNTSGNGSPGTYVLSGRPTAPGGGDVIIDNGTHGPINYSNLWDTAVAGGATSLQIADPFCLPDLVPAVGPVPSGGQFAGDIFPLGTCRSSYQPDNLLTPEEKTWMAYSHWDWRLNEHANVLFEFSMYRSHYTETNIASFPMTNGRPVVPANNPFNSLGTDLSWQGRPLGLAYPAKERQGDENGSRLALTLDGSFEQFFSEGFLSNWTYNVSAQYSGAYLAKGSQDADLRRMQDALNGFGGSNCENRFDGPAPSAVAGQGNCFYFSPFGADIYRSTFDPNSGFGSVGQIDANGNLVLAPAAAMNDVIGFNAMGTPEKDISETRLWVIEGVLSGDLFELPGGKAGMAVGYQRREETREVEYSNFAGSLFQAFGGPRFGGKGDRAVDAFFLEFAFPILDSVDIQLAGRYEDYGEVNSTDPKIGVVWRATESVSLRASAGTSFRAPSLANVVGNDRQSRVDEVRDTINAAEQSSGTFRTVVQTKNPLLEPEESTNFNLGVSWSPEVPWGAGNHNFQIDVDYFDFEFENKVTAESANALVASDPCGPQVQRDPLVPLVNPVLANQGATSCPANVGAILIVNTGFFNSGRTETSGLDISTSYAFDLGAHQFNIRTESTYLLGYDLQATNDGGTVDGLGFRNQGNAGVAAPELRANLMFNWSMNRHSGNVTVRYVDGLEDDSFGLREGGRGAFGMVDSHTEVDVQYRYTFGKESNYDITVGAVNAFDEEPPSAFFTGYEESLHNPLMRQLYVRMGAAF
jgi:iron complex outermembrane receptor protein